ncbi:chaplin [Streptomyces sp. NPDC127119]|uniref:chaplin n=1 Tax=Streptomyces sp. NPDC127119 TaxID=3345370 RepID=UPI0036252357
MKSRVIKSAALFAAVGAIVLGSGAAASADSGAQGAAVGSPGVLSGNLIQVPIHVPVNVCGNTVSIIGLLNPAFGNSCSNGGHDQGGMWR